MTLQERLTDAQTRLATLQQEHDTIVQFGQQNERAQFGVEGEIKALTAALDVTLKKKAKT